MIAGHINPPSDMYPALEAVRRAQERVAEEDAGVVLVSTDGLSKQGDRVHYDSRGLLELGRRFADAYLELTQP